MNKLYDKEIKIIQLKKTLTYNDLQREIYRWKRDLWEIDSSSDAVKNEEIKIIQAKNSKKKKKSHRKGSAERNTPTENQISEKSTPQENQDHTTKSEIFNKNDL